MVFAYLKEGRDSPMKAHKLLRGAMLNFLAVLGISAYLFVTAGQDLVLEQDQQVFAHEYTTVQMYAPSNRSTHLSVARQVAQEHIEEHWGDLDYALIQDSFGASVKSNQPRAHISSLSIHAVSAPQSTGLTTADLAQVLDNNLVVLENQSPVVDPSADIQVLASMAFTSGIRPSEPSPEIDFSVSRRINSSVVKSIVAQYDWDVDEAMLISWCESRFNAHAVNHNPPIEISIGLFQINTLAQASYLKRFSGVDDIVTWLKNPDNNVRFAYSLYSDLEWKPWRNCLRQLRNGSIQMDLG